MRGTLPVIKIILIAVLCLAVAPSLAISQIKYIEEGNKGLGVDLNYSYLNKTDNEQVQIGYSGSGVFDIGLIYAKASIVNLIGAYVERSVIKPKSDLPLGINLGLSISRSWFTALLFDGYGPQKTPITNEVNFRTQSASINLETYLLISASQVISFYPSIQIARTFTSTNPSGYTKDNPYMGYVYDIDIYIKSSDKSAIIITPGYLQMDEKNSFACSLAFMKYL
jgi:hypothetical protein